MVLGGGSDVASALREAAGPRGFDVIVDPLWGEPALAAMHAAAPGARHVQIGNSAAAMINLPATVVRLAALQILGFALFQSPVEVRREAYRSLTEHAARGEISIEVIQLPLADVASTWEQQKQGAPAKLVLLPWPAKQCSRLTAAGQGLEPPL